MPLPHSVRLHAAMAKSYLGYATKRVRAPLPTCFNIDPSAGCNIKCVFCPQAAPPEGISLGVMKMDIYERILDQIDRHTVCSALSLFLTGEPLMNKRLPEMVAMAVERLHTPPMIGTNAVLLNRERAEALVEAGVGSFLIDVCADRQHFEEVCPPAKWHEVVENIRTLREVVLERKSNVIISIKDVDYRGDTQEEKDASLERLKSMLGDGSPFFYQPYKLHNWSGEFAGEAEERYGYRAKLEEALFNPCSHMWLLMSFHATGDVSVCCRDTMREGVVGNIMDDELPDIWNGEPMLEMRRKMLAREHREIPVCKDCDRPFTGGYKGGSAIGIAKAFAAGRLRRLKGAINTSLRPPAGDN